VTGRRRENGVNSRVKTVTKPPLQQPTQVNANDANE
jgi:hypothetical protein